jgi:hypothetical protein
LTRQSAESFRRQQSRGSLAQASALSFSPSSHATKNPLAGNQYQHSAQQHALIYSKKKSHGHEIVRLNAPILLITPYNGFGGEETWSNWRRTNGLKMLLVQELLKSINGYRVSVLLSSLLKKREYQLL